MEQEIKGPKITDVFFKMNSFLLAIAGVCGLLAIYCFGWYALLISIVLTSLFLFQEERVIKFILLNYDFWDDVVVKSKPIRNIFSCSKQVYNENLLKSFERRFPKINFVVSQSNMAGGMESFLIKNASYVRVDKVLLDVLDKDDMEVMLCHEVGHIYHEHFKKMRHVFFVGYIIFIFFPAALPIFWIIGNYLSRQHEYEADAFSVSQTSLTQVVRLFEKNELRTEKSIWKEFITNYLSDYPSPKERLRRIK